MISNILLPYIKKSDNIYFADRIFVANSIINWILENYKDEKQIQFYLEKLESFLDKEIKLFWEDGTIKISKERKRK
jgi:HD superfamily phosphohydrolase